MQEVKTFEMLVDGEWVVSAVLEKAPNFVGIKDSSKDLVLLQEFVKLAPPSLTVLVGSDSVLLPGMAVGGQRPPLRDMTPEEHARFTEAFEAAWVADS